MTCYGLNWPPIQLDPAWHRGGGQPLDPQPPPWKHFKILETKPCRSQFEMSCRSSPNHTKLYQNHIKLTIMRSFEYFKKFQFWIFSSSLKITSLQYFQIPTSYVWCLMSIVRGPMYSWSWRSWQFLVYWSLTLKQLHLVSFYVRNLRQILPRCKNIKRVNSNQVLPVPDKKTWLALTHHKKFRRKWKECNKSFMFS